MTDPELYAMDLVCIRNLFLQEIRDLLIAIDIETDEELAERRKKIREIDVVLEEKKKEFKEQYSLKLFIESSTRSNM